MTSPVDAAHLVGEWLLKSLSTAKFFPNPPNTVIQPQKPQIYEFDNFRIDVANRQLLRDGENVPLPAKAFDMLVMLIGSGERLIGKDELFSRVWPDQIVEESNLTVQVSAIRKALGDRTSNPKYLMTVPGHGYRFIGVLRASTQDDEIVIERHSIARIESNSYENSGGAFADQKEVKDLSPLIKERRRVSSPRVALLAVVTILVGLLLTYFVFKRRESLPNVADNSAPSPIKSIAVLPFKPLLEKNRDELLEFGIADALITRLSTLKHVEVRQMSSVRGYTELNQNVLNAGREQRVDMVLDGSIQRSGELLRVTARLLDVRTGQQLWADTFDEPINDIFQIENSISRKVADSIVKVTEGEIDLLTKRYTHNPEAYSFYAKGRYLWHKRKKKDVIQSIDYFQQAIARDPNYALAYAGLADAYIVLPGLTNAPMSDTHPKAKVFALKALELDKQLTEPYVTLASIAADNWDWPEAEKQFKYAIELNQNYPTAHQWYGEYLVHVGRLDEALLQFQRALELDPTSISINVLLGQVFHFQRRYDEAIRQYQSTLELDENFVVAHLLLGLAYLEKSMTKESVSSFEKGLELSGGASNLLALLAVAQSRSQNKTAMKDALNKLRSSPPEGKTRARDWAIVYTGVGDKEKALEWLEKAYADRSELMLYLRVDPFFDSLRSEPRFAELLRRVGPAE